MPLKTVSRSTHWYHLLVRLSRRIDRQIDREGVHSAQVAFLARVTAERLGFSAHEVQSIYWAARLHDIGKVAVPASLLAKNGPLSDQEWQIMRLHPEVGANIVESFSRTAHLSPWIYHHQERFDGSGYPDGLRGEQIPCGARLLSVADAYEAMTHNRCYRPALGHTVAVNELTYQRGRQFDPQIVVAFLKVVDNGKTDTPAPI